LSTPTKYDNRSDYLRHDELYKANLRKLPYSNPNRDITTDYFPIAPEESVSYFSVANPEAAQALKSADSNYLRNSLSS